MNARRSLRCVAGVLALIIAACVPQSVPTQPQPAATPSRVTAVEVLDLAALPERPAVTAVTVSADGALVVTRPDGQRELGADGAALLAASATHVVWSDPCAACDTTSAAERRGLHVYAVTADRDTRVLADRLPRFNEVQLGDGWLAVLLQSAEHANAAELRVLDLETERWRSVSDRALAIGGAIHPLLAVQDEQLAWVDALGTTRDLALRVLDLESGLEPQAPQALTALPEALAVSRSLVAWRAGLVWSGRDLASGTAWEAAVVPADLGPGEVLAISEPQLVDRRLFWSLETSTGTRALGADVP